MMPVGDTAAHLRKQVGGLFCNASLGVILFRQASHKHRTSRLFLFEPFQSISPP
jgi:hypothetical protein